MAELIVTALSATTPATTSSGKRGKAKYTIADGVAQQVHDAADEAGAVAEVRDTVGNALEDGCDVTIAKDLKVKGGATIKSGTKVRGIRLLESPVDGHDISAKVPGQGQMYLKSSVVKRA